MAWDHKQDVHINNMVLLREQVLQSVEPEFKYRGNNPVAFASSWVIPPADRSQKADKLMEAIGVHTDGNISLSCASELWKLFRPFKFKFTGHSHSFQACIVNSIQEFIRTEQDASLVIPAIHNIIVASFPIHSTRSKRFQEVRRALFKVPHSTEWFKRVFQDGKYLSEPVSSQAQRDCSTHRTQLKQLSPVSIPLDKIKQWIREQHMRWVVENDDAVLHWAEAAVFLLLVCGSRKSELLHFSDYDAAFDEHWVIQSHMCKKRGKLPTVTKPLLLLTFSEFRIILQKVRIGFMTYMQESSAFQDTAFVWSSVLPEEVGRISQYPMRVAFNQCAIRQDGFKLHTLRAIYGNSSFLMYGPLESSLVLWIGRVLGHDLTCDASAAMFYMTVRVYRDEYKDLRAENVKLRGMLCSIKKFITTDALWVGT